MVRIVRKRCALRSTLLSKFVGPNRVITAGKRTTSRQSWVVYCRTIVWASRDLKIPFPRHDLPPDDVYIFNISFFSINTNLIFLSGLRYNIICTTWRYIGTWKCIVATESRRRIWLSTYTIYRVPAGIYTEQYLRTDNQNRTFFYELYQAKAITLTIVWYKCTVEEVIKNFPFIL